MSLGTRFVTYINLYQGNSKIRNVGFAKIERQEGQCKIEIHMKGAGYTNVSCPVYLFVRKEDRMEGIEIGELTLQNGAGDSCFLINVENISDSGYTFGEVKGFLILLSDHIMFASQWDENEIKRERFTIREKEEAPLLQAAEVALLLEEESETIEAPESIEVPTENNWEKKWQFILENYPVLTPFEGEEELACVRLELKDLRLLPKAFWYLGNNSFLLHGFFNYRYLILGKMELEEGTKWFLGVPGVFQSQEKVMAAIFGFPEYKSEKIAVPKTGQFGYWYRYLEHITEQ